MNSPLRPEALLPDDSRPQPKPQAAEPASVWHSRFGAMRIEVIDGQPHVNGQRVEPWPHPAPPLKDPS